jgi:hypothetical protein
MLILVHGGCTKATTSPTANWPDNFGQLPVRIKNKIGGDLNLHRQFDKHTRDGHAITFTYSPKDDSLAWEVNGLVYFDPREESFPCEA